MSERAKEGTVLFTSTAPQNWCLTRRGDQTWMYLTVVRTDDHSVAGSIDTNDVEKVKESLSSSAENIYVKAIHILATTRCGVSTAEVLELSEAKLNGSVVFHRLKTMFGVTQIDGPVNLLPEQLEQCTFTTLYKSEFVADRCEGFNLCRN